MVRDAVQQGYKEGTFKHPRWIRPFRGVRALGPQADSLQERALLYVPRLRERERFSHATTLALLGCPIRVSKSHPVDVSTPRPLATVRCVGTTGHKHALGSPEYWCSFPTLDTRVPISAPLLAVQQAAMQLPFSELVVALDHLLLNDPRRYDRWLRLSPDQLAHAAQNASGRGSVRFRAAAALARVGAESRMETLMRLCAVRVGMPDLRLQLDIYDDDGQWIGRFDTVDVRTRTIFEYDGEQHHFSRKQRRRDPQKLQKARDAGWRVMVLYVEDVLDTPLQTGQRMLEFSGNTPRPVPVSMLRLLDECAEHETVPAIPYESSRLQYERSSLT